MENVMEVEETDGGLSALTDVLGRSPQYQSMPREIRAQPLRPLTEDDVRRIVREELKDYATKQHVFDHVAGYFRSYDRSWD